jgi:hypothetical protein
MTHPQQKYKSNQTRKWTALLSMLIACSMVTASCTVRLIGDYDDTIDKGVTDIQQTAETYFTKLASTPDTPYDQSFHDGIATKLIVLETRANSLPMYSIISQQVALLQNTFAAFEQVDKITPRPLVNDKTTNKPPLVTNTESAVTTSVESILKLELALKRGSMPASTSTSH